MSNELSKFICAHEVPPGGPGGPGGRDLHWHVMHTPIHEWPANSWREHRFGLSPERWARLGRRSFWITGAGTGYGRAMAVALACAGAQVFLTGRRREKLEETCREARALGGNAERCIPVPADITLEDEVEAACRLIRDNCATLHGLLNNAAVSQNRQSPWPLQEDSPASWEKMFRTNVTAPWLVSRAILPHMISGGEVRIVFMTSEAGWAFTPGVGQYNITKAALNNLGASLAHECAARYPQGDIQINVLNPGEARTEMNQGSQRSPYTVVPMMLQLLSHPAGGPNGRFFHADGRHLSFTYAQGHERSLSETGEEAAFESAAIPISSPTAPSPQPWWRRLIARRAS